MSGYQPQNPFQPYGGMKSSKTGSRAVAAMPPQQPYPDFGGIGSLPSAPAQKPPLQGGLGKVMAGGRDLGDLIVRQTGRGGAHGHIDVPRVVTQPAVNQHVLGGGRLNRAINKSLANPVPAFEGGQMLNIDPRSGYDPMAIMHASQASDQGLDPQSEAYAQMLLGHPVQGQAPVRAGLMGDSAGDRVGWYQPPRAPQQLPEELTAQALPMDQMQGQAPFMPDASGFQMRQPELDNSQPTFSDGMGGQLPADLDNPFQNVSNDRIAPSSLTREDDLNNGFGDQPDPYQQYAMPQYNRPDPTGFYAGLDGVATQGINNKTRMDMMRWQDWQRDNQERGWDEFNGGVLNPLMGMFVKDPATRARMQQSGQAQSNRYMQNRPPLL